MNKNTKKKGEKNTKIPQVGRCTHNWLTNLLNLWALCVYVAVYLPLLAALSTFFKPKAKQHSFCLFLTIACPTRDVIDYSCQRNSTNIYEFLRLYWDLLIFKINYKKRKDKKKLWFSSYWRCVYYLQWILSFKLFAYYLKMFSFLKRFYFLINFSV